MESLAFDAGANRLYFGGHMGTTFEQSVCGRPLERGSAHGSGQLRELYMAAEAQIAPSTGNGIGAWTFLTNTQLWVGGRISSIGGVTQAGIARFTL